MQQPGGGARPPASRTAFQPTREVVMDRDEAAYRPEDEAGRPVRDTGVIGSEAEEPGPGRDTRLTEPAEPVQEEHDVETVAMSGADPMRTRLGAQEADAVPIGADAPEAAPTRDTGVIGSEAEEPGPGRDTSMTDADPAAVSDEPPTETVAMSGGDPMRTRLGVQEADAEPIGADVPEAEAGGVGEEAFPPDERRP
jgi:hypothetical protein